MLQSWALNNKADIILLQETHLTIECGQLKMFEINYSHGLSNSRGVLIGLSKKLEFSNIVVEKDNEVRLLMLKFKLQNSGFEIINIYAPNDLTEQRRFYRQLENFIEEHHEENNILCMGGDFNITLSQGDRKQKIKNRYAITEAMFEIATKYNMVDVWRQLHPKRRQYSWSRKNYTIASRLDYWWVQNRLLQKTINCNIIEAIYTDHRAVIWQLQSPVQVNKGPGIWKLNDLFLKEDTFCKKVDYIINKYETDPALDAVKKLD